MRRNKKRSGGEGKGRRKREGEKLESIIIPFYRSGNSGKKRLSKVK